MRKPVIRQKRTRALGLLVMMLPLFAFNQADTLSPSAYYLLLSEIQVNARSAFLEKHPERFHRNTSSIPQNIFLKLPPGNGIAPTQKISFIWIKNWFNVSIPIGDGYEFWDHHRNEPNEEPESEFEEETEESEWEETEEYFSQTREDSLAVLVQLDSLLSWELRAIKADWGPNLDLEKAEENAKKILSEKIYDFDRDKFEEEKEEEDEAEELHEDSEFLDFSLSFQKFLKILLALLAFLVFAWLISRLLKLTDFRKVDQQVALEMPGGLLAAEDPKESGSLKKLAEENRNEGKLESAIRYAYLALIVQLHEKGVVAYHPDYTNWEYFRKLIELRFPADATHFITQKFDETVYGQKPITQDDADLFLEYLKTMERKLKP